MRDELYDPAIDQDAFIEVFIRKTLSNELQPAVRALRENLPIDELEGDSYTIALESGSYLWSTGLM